MLLDYSFIPVLFHRAVSLYLFVGFCSIGLFYFKVYFPYNVRPMSLKHVPSELYDLYMFVLIMLMSAWIGYAIGEWFVISILTIGILALYIFVLQKLLDDADGLSTVLFYIFLTFVFVMFVLAVFGVIT